MMGSLTILHVERLTCSGELGAWGEGGSMCLGELAQVRDSGGGGGGGGLGFTYAGGSGSHVQGDSRGGVFTYMFKGLGFTCSGGAGGSHVLGGLGVRMFWGGWGFAGGVFRYMCSCDGLRRM